MNWKATIHDDGTIEFHGVLFGNKMRYPIHYRMNDIIVIKVPGHSRWGDLLHPSVYEPASFHVVRIKEESLAVRWNIEQIVHFGLKSER